jgi:hypothetical protein
MFGKKIVIDKNEELTPQTLVPGRTWVHLEK